MKQHSVFFPSRLREIADINSAKYSWAATIKDRVIRDAEPWLQFSDDELWAMMFGPTITRSWMVWSNGYCPTCGVGVPSYGWQLDAFVRPWKVQCPHCHELFPKNDFYRFYLSGLDEHGVFNPQLADRALLFNVEHPDPQDPLHGFGVDDGEGYVQGEHRWRFIGYYLVYGQWKQLVFGGIKKLAAAYAMTGELVYGHKAAVLLDRVADLYPSFDGLTQLIAYEKPHGPGYVSTWHDACMETRDLALAYDQIFDVLRKDESLIAFLAKKASDCQLPNLKLSPADIQTNIEQRILYDALRQPFNPENNKIAANPPQTDITLATIQMVLGWPDNKEEVYSFLDRLLERCTVLDGLTGEKGLTVYSMWTSRSLFLFLEQWARVDSTSLEVLLERHPGLQEMYRFFNDTWCLQSYYPTVGDSSSFLQRWDQYCGVIFAVLGGPANEQVSWWEQFIPAVPVSGFTFLWRLYRLTADPAYVQAIYRANDFSVEGLPYDPFVENPVQIQREVRDVIARQGSLPRLGSVNKQKWRLAILRSGYGANSRAAWLHYDHLRGHGHHDGLNLGLYAKGLDLLPDFGYPPTHYGGWDTAHVLWYAMPASHNLVVVDGRTKQSVTEEIRTTLWVASSWAQGIRVSGKGLIDGEQFERTVVLVDISEEDSYLIDVFRVVGGTDHAKFTHSNFGTVTTFGLSLQPTEPYGHGTQMRNFCVDLDPRPGWGVDWEIEACGSPAHPGPLVHLRYTDLTYGAKAFLAEAWISKTFPALKMKGYEEAWLNCVIARRQAQQGPLASTFVSLLEPYEGSPKVSQVRRLPLQASDGCLDLDANVALEIQLPNGDRDLFILLDVEDPLGRSRYAEDAPVLQTEWQVALQGEMCLIRKSQSGVQRFIVGKGRALQSDELVWRWPCAQEVAEGIFHP
ncbi:MAG: heparinase II/III family protein [Gemmatales bacterium]|nr:heparinase II/III family protein [Gemmatales bacterium]